MNIFLIGTVWLILILFVLNIIGILVISAEERYCIAPVSLWILLFFFFGIFKVINSSSIEAGEIVYEKTKTEEGNSDLKLYMNLEEAKKRGQRENNKLFILLGFQTIFSCFLQFVGSSKTGRPYYTTAFRSFFVLTLIWVILEFTLNQSG